MTSQEDGTYQLYPATVSELNINCFYCENCPHASILIIAHPGTTKDIDFYFSGICDENNAFPPDNTWITVSQRGVDPPPRVTELTQF